jgi:hypothetical protein
VFGRPRAWGRAQGDAFLVVFEDAPAAVAAAADAQRALAAATWPEDADVKVGWDSTGQGIAGGDDYVGVDIDRAARIAAAATAVRSSSPTRRDRCQSARCQRVSCSATLVRTGSGPPA